MDNTHEGDLGPNSVVTEPFTSILAHAILHSAKVTLDTLTPFALQRAKIRFVRSSSNETVGTTVLRSAPLVFGNAWPP